MNGSIFILTIILASAFGFAHYSDAEFTETHEAEIVQLSLVGVIVLLIVYAIFSQSFLLFSVEVAGTAIGLGTGRVTAAVLKKYGKYFHSGEKG